MMATTNSPNFQENSSNMCCDDEYLKTHIPEGCPITYHLDQYVKSVEWKKLTNANKGTIIKEKFEIIHLPSDISRVKILTSSDYKTTMKNKNIKVFENWIPIDKPQKQIEVTFKILKDFPFGIETEYLSNLFVCRIFRKIMSDFDPGYSREKNDNNLPNNFDDLYADPIESKDISDTYQGSIIKERFRITNLPAEITKVQILTESTNKIIMKNKLIKVSEDGEWTDVQKPQNEIEVTFEFLENRAGSVQTMYLSNLFVCRCSRKLPDQTMLPQNNATTTQMGLSQNEIEIGDFDLTNLPDLDENFEIPDFEEFSSEIEEEENENLSQQQQISNSKVQTMPDQIISSPEQVKISQPKPINSEVERNNSDVDTDEGTTTNIKISSVRKVTEKDLMQLAESENISPSEKSLIMKKLEHIRENTSSGSGSDKENTINEKSADTSNRLNNNEAQIENVQKSLENPCIENENEKDNQVDVIERSEKEISKENPEIDLAPSKITDYFQLSPNKVKDTAKRRCKKQKIPISSSKSQGNSCTTTLNENDQVITGDEWQSIDNRIITPNDAKVATSTLVGNQKSTEETMPVSTSMNHHVESQKNLGKIIINPKQKQQIEKKKKESQKRKANPTTLNSAKKARVTTENNKKNDSDGRIFSCIIPNSKCEVKFHNDQELLNHCFQVHKLFLQSLWNEDEDNENDNYEGKFEKFCKEIVIELLLAEYKSPTKRLKTFKNWPNKSVKPKDLANAGLLFTGSEDNAKCVYCGNDMDEWEDGDIPMDVHQEGFPNCPFVRDQSIENIANNRFSCPYRQCQEKYSTVQSLEKHAIEFHQADVLTKKDFSMKNKAELLLKEYKCKSYRRATFADWVNPYVKADDLSNSGFLYTGWGGSVQCVFCGIVIRNWKFGDSPMTKHKLYSPTCGMGLESELPKSKNSQKNLEDQNLAIDNRKAAGQKRNAQDLELPKNQPKPIGKGKNNTKRKSSVIIPQVSKNQNDDGNIIVLKGNTTQDVEIPKNQTTSIEEDKMTPTRIKLIIPKVSKDPNLASPNPDSNVAVQKRNTQDLEVPKNRQNLMKKVKNIGKRTSLIVPKVSKDKSLTIPIIPKVTKDQNLTSTKPDIPVQKNTQSPMIGKEKRNLKVFSCVVSQECQEKFETIDEVEQHGEKSHQDLEIPTKDINELLLGDFKSETDRLKTYAGWPNSFISTQDLANSGFIFTGKEDNVQCAFCASVIDGWEDGDIPMEEHKKVNENCAFVLGKHINLIVPSRAGGKKAKCWYLQCDAEFKERKSLMIHVKRHHQTIVDSDPTEGFRSLEYKLHHGWSKQAVERNKPNPQGKYLWDKYIYSPTGKYLRSNPQLEKYIEENPNFECDRNETNFIWNEKELLKFQTKWNAQSIHRRTQDSTSSQ